MITYYWAYYNVQIFYIILHSYFFPSCLLLGACLIKHETDSWTMSCNTLFLLFSPS